MEDEVNSKMQRDFIDSQSYNVLHKNRMKDLCDILKRKDKGQSEIRNGECRILMPLKTCAPLPRSKVQASSFALHISCFLQYCKKGKP